ncbi:MAG: hypothetical protein ACOYT8_05615 [Candidatus Dependentiae bacterium]
MKQVQALFLSMIIIMGGYSHSILASSLFHSIKKFYHHIRSTQSKTILQVVTPPSSINFQDIVGLENAKQILTHITALTPMARDTQDVLLKKLIVLTGDSRTGKTFLSIAFVNELKKCNANFLCLMPRTIIDKNNINQLENDLEHLNKAVLIFDESCFYEESHLKKPIFTEIIRIFTKHIEKNPSKELFCVMHLFSGEVKPILNEIDPEIYQHIPLTSPTESERTEYIRKWISSYKYPNLWNKIEITDLVNLTGGLTYSLIDGLLQKCAITAQTQNQQISYEMILNIHKK